MPLKANEVFQGIFSRSTDFSEYNHTLNGGSWHDDSPRGHIEEDHNVDTYHWNHVHTKMKDSIL